MGRVKSKPTKAKAKAKAKVKPKREIKNTWLEKSIVVTARIKGKFKDICDKYHIEQKTINNQPVGFLRTEIEDLKVQLELEKEKADV